MKLLNYKKLQSFLKKSYGYTDEEASSLLNQVRDMTPYYKKILYDWFMDDKPVTAEERGITVNGLMQYQGMNVISGLVMLDRLKRDRDAASAALTGNWDHLDIDGAAGADIRAALERDGLLEEHESVKDTDIPVDGAGF